MVSWTVGCGSGTSVPVTITAQPASATVMAGQSATFAVVATGPGTLAYQWSQGGTAIAGATGSSYTVQQTTVGQSGTSFDVTVTNGTQTVTATPATLTVMPLAAGLQLTPIPTQVYGAAPVAVTSQSASNAPVTYTVVSGPGTLAGNLVTPTGAGTVVLRASQAAAGNYGPASATTSFTVGLNVAVGPIAPAAVTLAPGQQTFMTTVTGSPTRGVSWGASAGTISATGVWTSPTTAGTYTITATSTDDPTKMVSTTATVTSPVLTTQPIARNLCTGSALSLSAAAQYAASFQWFRNGAAISGATQATYTVAAASAADVGSYYVAATNPAGTVTSSPATVTVGSTLTSTPQAATVLQPATATFAVAAQGQSPFKYQWYSAALGATTGSAIAGATAASFSTGPTAYSLNGTNYYAVVTDSCGAALTSSTAALTVNSLPVITQQPSNQTFTPGTPVPLSVTATGTPGLTYQWSYRPAGMKASVAIPGGTSATYTVPAAAATASNTGDRYFVTVSNAFGSAVSQPAALQTGANTASQWVVGWGASPENALPGPENPGGNEQSFRLFLNPTVSGMEERVHLSNLFGKTPITVGAARLAAASSSNGVSGNAIDSTQDFPLSFQGATSITLQPGQEVTSDPVQIAYTLGQKLAVTMYVQGNFPALTQHESQVNVNYATANGAGNTTNDASGASFTQANTEWYLLTGVDVYGAYQGTVAIFGSSSIDGHGSDYNNTNFYPAPNFPVPGQDNDRPSDWLGRQLTAAGYNLGVLNAGTIGDPAGPDARTATGAAIAGVDRMQHDVLDQPGIKAVVIYFGGVDIRGDCKPATAVEVSLSDMVSQAYAAGVRVVLATVPPAEYCTTVQPLPTAAAPYNGDLNPGPENPGSAQRRALNDWIRTVGATLPGVAAIADFDAVLRDPVHPDFLIGNFYSSDNFHPNGLAYGVQSSAIPLPALLGP